MNESTTPTPEPMADERPRCGTPCLKHAHACDRSPRHTGFHRDVRQKGDHACEWDTPGPKDFPAVMAALRTARAELATRCDMADCEQFREWLSREKAEADKRAWQAEAERDEARAEVKRLRAALGIEVRRNSGRSTVPSGAPDSVVRSWAREHNIPVNPKGRVAPDARSAYEAAWRAEQDGGDPC